MAANGHVIAESDWAEVVDYLYQLDDNQIKRLGGKLGLSAANVGHMRDLPEDMVSAWLRGEEEVTKKCGQQLTWEVLAQNLKEMKPAQTNIAEKILKERCTQGVPKHSPEGGAVMTAFTAFTETALVKTTVTASQRCDDVQRQVAQGVPKLNLSAVQKYAERLKALYSKRKMPDYLKGRHLPTSKFVSLALISRVGVSKKDMDEFTRKTVQDGDIDAILMKKSPLESKHIGKLKNGSLVTCMLLQGGPGTGKTTFAWNLCREWESGELFKEYSLVVFIPLRRKQIREGEDIRELFSIANSNSKTQTTISEELEDSQGESVLLVLDGYDELPEYVQKDSMISKVVDGEYLPKASVLVTSRPSACGELYDKCRRRDENFQHIEVLGFTQDKIKAYIEDNVDSKQLPQFNKYLSSHPKVMTMMYNPLQCALTVEVCKKLFEDGSYLPKTRTKLYETNVLMTMSREHPTLIGRRTNSLQKLPKALHEKFVKLCHLAYDGIDNRHIIFEDVPEEIKEIGLLVSEPELDSVSLSSKNYNFFHLSIQEFCAAYYISSLPEQEQTTLLSCYSSEGQFREVIIFLCGMSSNPERTMDIVYSCVKKKNIKDIDTGSEDTGSEDTGSEDTGSEDEVYISQWDTLLLFHCAFESQCGDTCSSLVKKINSSIHLSYLSGLTPSDMSAVGFVICKSKHPIALYFHSADAEGLQALFNQFHLTLEEHSSLAIEKIDLFHNNIGDDAAKCLSEGLKYCPKLQTLHLDRNNIRNDGAKCLSEGLKYCPKLQELNLHRNKIGDVGAKCLSEGLKYCPELQTLHVSWNSLSYEGRVALEKMRDEVNSKRGPHEKKLNVHF